MMSAASWEEQESTGAVTLFSPKTRSIRKRKEDRQAFDVTHAFTLSAAQDLHFEHLGLQSDRTQLLTKGWELLSISTITSGSPVYGVFGIQQTGAGNDWRGPAGRGRNTGPFERRQFQRDRATIILDGARTTQVSLPFPSGLRGGPDQTPGRFGNARP